MGSINHDKLLLNIVQKGMDGHITYIRCRPQYVVLVDIATAWTLCYIFLSFPEDSSQIYKSPYIHTYNYQFGI